MSTRKDQLLRRAAGNDRSRAVALTREEKALRAVFEKLDGAGVQPDLSQNDPDAPDYVKGKESFVTKEEMSAAITGAMEASY